MFGKGVNSIPTAYLVMEKRAGTGTHTKRRTAFVYEYEEVSERATSLVLTAACIISKPCHLFGIGSFAGLDHHYCGRYGFLPFHARSDKAFHFKFDDVAFPQHGWPCHQN